MGKPSEARRGDIILVIPPGQVGGGLKGGGMRGR